MKQINGSGNVNQGRDDKPNNTDVGDDAKPAKPAKAPRKGKTIPATRLIGKVKGL